MNRHINKLITFTRSIVLAGNTHSLKGVRCASSYLSRTHTCGELDAGHTGQEVELCGWVQYQRMSQFITIRDRHGVTQVVLPDQNKDDSIPKESVVKVKGLVQKRPKGQANKKMATGDIEIRVTKIEILNACRGKLPFHIHDFHKVNENLRMEHRYLDIRNSTIQNNLRIRSKFVMKLREFLCNDHGFIDIETPTLFRRTPGGAKEFVVPTHLAGKFYSLPQSPQQFKQLLMAGGCDRYMQVARCYRDETAKPDRQPEFTQVDLEMSFVTQDGIKSLIEDMLVYSWPDHLEPIVAPFPRMSYADAMKYYGSDKPDTRFDVKLSDLTASMSGCTFEPFRKGTTSRESSIQAINFPSAGKMLSNKDIKALDKVCSDLQKGSETVWHAIIKIKEDKIWQGSLGENLGDAYQQIINEKLNLNSGDLLVLGSGTNTDVHTLVGRLRVEIANLLEGKGQTIREKGMNFLWVEDFPLFLPKEDGSPGCESAHHPFTAPYPEDEGLVYTTPEQARSQHYDLVLNGSEIGGGSIRIHNAELQRYILSEVLKEDSSTLEHLLRALELGCPPHGGIALGLDRLVAILCNTTSIKDVIAFPKSIEGRDVMSQAPATIEEKDLQYYHIRSTSC